jgi:hypothetical protein
MSANRYVPGFVSTTARSSKRAKGFGFCPSFCPPKVAFINPIEPKWVHAKKAMVEPDGLLSAQQLAERICAHFGCSHEPHLSLSEKVV